jgi:hypothetical protein
MRGHSQSHHILAARALHERNVMTSHPQCTTIERLAAKDSRPRFDLPRITDADGVELTTMSEITYC